MRARVVVAFGVCSLPVACSLLTDLGGLAGGDVDASLPDASPEATAEDAAPIDASKGGSAPESGACTPERTVCGAACVDLRTDPANCGACGTRCSASTACFAGHCETPYYLSPAGDDTKSGTSQQEAWKTFDHAISKLVAGTALVLLDGTYTQATNGSLLVDCSANASNGASGDPVVVTALHERQAVIASDGTAAAVSIRHCQYWIVDGVTATNTDAAPDAGGSSSSTVSVYQSNDIELRRLLVSGTNRYFSANGMALSNVTGSVVADTEIYAFHASGLYLYGGGGVSLRRVYAHSRWTHDIPGGVVTANKNEGDQGFRIEYATGSIALENAVVEAADTAYDLCCSAEIKVLGAIALGTGDGMDIFPSPSERTYVQDFVALDVPSQGLHVKGGSDNTVSNVTLLRTQGALLETGGGVMRNAGSYAGTGVGVYLGSGNNWLVESSNASGNATADFYSVDAGAEAGTADAGTFKSCTTVSPTGVGTGPGQCVVYVPPASNMKDAGEGGADIGANIVYRYEDGALTGTKLWQSDGRFPCGAVFAGINDAVGVSCTNVHKRLNLVPSGCPVP